MDCALKHSVVVFTTFMILFAAMPESQGILHDPVATFTWTISGRTVNFNATSSYDSDGTITLYEWEFGDGITGIGINTTHMYTKDGVFMVNLTVTDNTLITNTTSHFIAIDTTPPLTEVTTIPHTPNGKNGWYLTAVTISFISSDAVTKVKETRYRLNTGSWQVFTTPFTLSTSGLYIIQYYSVDNESNAETVKILTLNIDNKKPYTECYTSKADNNGWYKQIVYIGLEPYDNESGVATFMYRIDGDAFCKYTDDLVFHGGRHVLEYFATDMAGNAESLNTKELFVDSTTPKITLIPSGGIYMFGRKTMISNGTIIIGSITIEAVCSDTYSGIEKVGLFIDGTFKSTATNSPYTWEWDEFSVGTHELEVVAYDYSGNMAETLEKVLFINFKIESQKMS